MRSSVLRVVSRTAVFVIAVAVVVACAPRVKTDSTTPRRDTDIMDSTEIRGDAAYSTLYDAISNRRPNWLLPRGGPTGQRDPELGVWIEGGVRSLGVSYLRNLRPADVRQVRRLSTTESLHTYSWPWGGLVITLR